MLMQTHQPYGDRTWHIEFCLLEISTYFTAPLQGPLFGALFGVLFGAYCVPLSDFFIDLSPVHSD